MKCYMLADEIRNNAITAIKEWLVLNDYEIKIPSPNWAWKHFTFVPREKFYKVGILDGELEVVMKTLKKEGYLIEYLSTIDMAYACHNESLHTGERRIDGFASEIGRYKLVDSQIRFPNSIFDERGDKREYNTIKKELTNYLDKLVCIVPNLHQLGEWKGGNSVLYLSSVGDLWRNPKSKYCYPMEKGDRHRIIKILIANRGYNTTPSISAALGGKSQQSIRTEIAKIRQRITKYLGIDGKKIIKGRKGSGYKIGSKYKIELKN
jgi:hypothetical protein